MTTHMRIGDEADYEGARYRIVHVFDTDSPGNKMRAVAVRVAGKENFAGAVVGISDDGKIAGHQLSPTLFPPPPPSLAWVNVFKSRDGGLIANGAFSSLSDANKYGAFLRVGCIRVELAERFDA